MTGLFKIEATKYPIRCCEYSKFLKKQKTLIYFQFHNHNTIEVDNDCLVKLVVYEHNV
jgi:hypothetical protein